MPVLAHGSLYLTTGLLALSLTTGTFVRLPYYHVCSRAGYMQLRKSARGTKMAGSCKKDKGTMGTVGAHEGFPCRPTSLSHPSTFPAVTKKLVTYTSPDLNSERLTWRKWQSFVVYGHSTLPMGFFSRRLGQYGRL